MQIVNGYVCFTSCDATAAKKGHDPRNPTNDPIKAAALDLAKAAGGGATVQFGGLLADRSAASSTVPSVARLVDKSA